MTVETTDSPPLLDSDGLSPAPEGNDTGEAQKGNKEARYRTERNEARAEVANLQARMAVLQRAEVERLASAGLSHPSDLFSLSGNELVDYLTDDGTVDAERVAADVAAIVAERPGLKPLAPAVDRTQGHWGNPGKGTPTFSDLFNS
jgi:hypothetical protein